MNAVTYTAFTMLGMVLGAGLLRVCQLIFERKKDA